MAKKRAIGPYRVFLSHSHKDCWIAKQCAAILTDRGSVLVEVFLDEKDIEGGESIAESILKNIEGCDEFLVLLTRYSRVRPWVLVEIGAAWGLRKPIVAVIDKLAPKEMPDIVSPYKAMDLNDFDR